MKISKDLFDKIVVTYIRMGNNATDFMGIEALANRLSCTTNRVNQVKTILKKEKFIDIIGATCNTRVITIKNPSEKDREELFARYFMRSRKRNREEVDQIISWLKRNGYSGVISSKSNRFGAQKIVSYTF